MSLISFLLQDEHLDSLPSLNRAQAYPNQLAGVPLQKGIQKIEANTTYREYFVL